MRTRVLGLIVLAVGLSCLAATPVSTIKVGALYNLTGGMSSIDGPGLQGMRLAVEEINAGGGVLGRLLELVAIADAIRRAGAVDPMAITAALAVTQGFQGVTGTIGYAGGSRLPRKSVSIIHVQDGRFGFAAEVIP
jgi:ABC-type branched-subunit amino acid transport system substrate-binding protein